jgi:threonine dehydrogenase-like Zn-dependent dehydrogenase
VAKAWEQVERIGSRAHWEPAKAVITGAGPVGLLAALLGVQRGFEVHVLDRVTDGPKPGLVAALNATYHTGKISELELKPDVVVECTGVGELVIQLAGQVASAAVICLAGISSGQRSLPVNVDEVNAAMVLENAVLFGTVTAADPVWLSGLISRRLPLSSWPDALDREPHDVKVVVDLTR